MSGWRVDPAGVDSLLTELDGCRSSLVTAVRDADEGFFGASRALTGTVGASFASFQASRADAPGELTVRADNAAGALVAATQALAAGDQEMADVLRRARLRADGALVPPTAGHGFGEPIPW